MGTLRQTHAKLKRKVAKQDKKKKKKAENDKLKREVEAMRKKLRGY